MRNNNDIANLISAILKCKRPFFKKAEIMEKLFENACIDSGYIPILCSNLQKSDTYIPNYIPLYISEEPTKFRHNIKEMLKCINLNSNFSNDIPCLASLLNIDPNSDFEELIYQLFIKYFNIQ